MFELYLELKLKTPLLITGLKFGETFKCLDYISGSTMRGTLASLLISDGNTPDSDKFKNIFVNGEVWFGNLYYKYTDENIVHYPLPLSRYRCKVDVTHSYLDCLMNDIPDKCSKCHSRMVNKAITLEMKKMISMHNAIDFSTQTTAEGKLFSYELVCEGQSFSGKIKSSNKEYLEKISDAMRDGFYLGKGNSRGLGEVEVTKADISETQPNIGQITNSFTLTMLSDAILMNEDGTFLRTLTGKYLGIGDDVMPKEAFARTKEVTLWNSAADLPRETVIALSAGSCFNFLADYSEELEQKLLSLEIKGIGIRREQGFGEVKINDKRHIKDQLPVIREDKPPEETPDAIEQFQNECLSQFEKDKEKLEIVNKPSALFELVRVANSRSFDELSETLVKQTGRDKSIFKKFEIGEKIFGEYIKEEILDKCEKDIDKDRKMAKAKAGLLALCRFVQAYHK